MSLTPAITSILLFSSCQGFRSSSSGSFSGSQRFGSSSSSNNVFGSSTDGFDSSTDGFDSSSSGFGSSSGSSVSSSGGFSAGGSNNYGSNSYSSNSGSGGNSYSSSSNSGSSSSYNSNSGGGSFRKSFGGGGSSLAQVLATRLSNEDPSSDAGKESLVPNKLAEAPPQTAKIYWAHSSTRVTPGEAIDSIKMTDRPGIRWTYDPSALYTILCLDEGIPDLQPANLAYIHWMVSNVPGDKVYAGDENYEYVPPFGFQLDSNQELVDDGSPLHAILFLVYKQSERVEVTEGQNGCNPELGTRVGNKDALAAKYNLGQPIAGNVIFTKYSPAGTDYLFCKFTRCRANPRNDGPFPLPLPGINDQPQCQP